MHIDMNPAMLCSGHAACPGCMEALSARHVLGRLGPDTIAVIPPSCMAIIAGPQPYSSLKIPVYQPTLEASAAAASGLRRALDATGRRSTQVLVLAGDGGTYDIGLQALSSAAERNEDILYVCLDNEGYMNTGAQKSSSTPRYARTTSTPQGKRTRKKNLTAIAAAHGVPYAATASVGYLADMARKIDKARSIHGFRLLTLLVPCVEGWGLPDDGGLDAARCAVDCGAFPLYEVEDGSRYTINHMQRTRPLADYLALQKRYRGMSPGDVGALQADVDRGWEWLVRLAQADEGQLAP